MSKSKSRESRESRESKARFGVQSYREKRPPPQLPKRSRTRGCGGYEYGDGEGEEGEGLQDGAVAPA